MGPIRPLQFVIELVGPHTVPAQSIKAILNPEWQRVLGSPEIYVMAGADKDWRPLVETDPSSAYDSVALGWDLISPRGEMSPQSAQALWNAAEDLAKQLSRRALAMPVPADIPQTIRQLKERRDSLDVGVNLSVVPGSGSFREQDIWAVAQSLKLDLSVEGCFQKKTQASELPLFEVSPIGNADRFSLAQAQQGLLHEGLLLGFSIPHCPDPLGALESCLLAAQSFAQNLGGTVLDEEDRPLTKSGENQMRSNLNEAVKALLRAGLPPGSPAAMKLFSD